MSEIIHDKSAKKFILKLDNNEQAEVVYKLEQGKMLLIYSEVPVHLRGKGIGKKLVLETFERLTDEGFKAKAICSYIQMTAKRSSKWKEIIEH